MSDVANVRNPRLCRALKQSLEEKPNVHLKENCELQNFQQQDGRISSALVMNTGTSGVYTKSH